MDALIDQGQVTIDRAKRKEIYDKAQRLMVEHAMAVWTFSPDLIEIVQSYVQYEQHFTALYFNFRTVSLTSASVPGPRRAGARASVVTHVALRVIRTLSILPTLFGVTLAVFLMIRLIPGTIVDQMIGTEGSLQRRNGRALRPSSVSTSRSTSSTAGGSPRWSGAIWEPVGGPEFRSRR